MKKFQEPEVEVVELDNVDMMCDSDGPCTDYACQGGYGTTCSGGHTYNNN